MSVEVFRASDGYEFYLRRTRPAGRPRARLVFLHGARSHAGWYTRTRDEFADRGYEVLFVDRRGAGLNTARPGDAPGFRRLLRDIAELVRRERRDRSALPTALVGISWGGKLALALPAFEPGLVQAVALITPGFRPRVSPPLTLRLRMLAARLLRPTRRFPLPLNDPDLFTADPAWQQFLRENRHDTHEATARFFVASAMLDAYLRRTRRRTRPPVACLLAGGDRVIDNAATRRYLAGLTCESLMVREYTGAHHTLEFEPSEGAPWSAELAAWLGRHGV